MSLRGSLIENKHGRMFPRVIWLQHTDTDPNEVHGGSLHHELAATLGSIIYTVLVLESAQKQEHGGVGEGYDKVAKGNEAKRCEWKWESLKEYYEAYVRSCEFETYGDATLLTMLEACNIH